MRHIGIDVDAAALVVARDDESATLRFDNTPAGHRKLVRWCERQAPARVCLEATGISASMSRWPSTGPRASR